MNELMKNNRLEEMKAIYRFINHCNVEEIAQILSEIIVRHSNLLAFDPTLYSLGSIKSLKIIGECIHLRTEE